MARTKNIRFDIYRAQLSIDDKGHNKYNHAIQKVKEFDTLLPDGWTSSKRASFKLWSKHKEEIEEEMKQSGTQWLLDEIINAAINDLLPNTAMQYDEEIIEIDRDSYINRPDKPNILSFQITRLRTDSLPAKKKIGRPRTDIELDDDEYIGEFTVVMYDASLGIVAIQSNRYGVGPSVICRYLNYLRKQYYEIIGERPPKYLAGQLKPVIDDSLIQRALEADCIKKVRVRCSNESVDALISEDNTYLGGIARSINQQAGVVFDVTMSVKTKVDKQSLPKDAIKDVARRFISMISDPKVSKEIKKDAKVEMTIVSEEDASAEAVDFLIPKVNFYVHLTVEDRVPVRSEYFHDRTMESYEGYMPRLAMLLRGE